MSAVGAKIPSVDIKWHRSIVVHAVADRSTGPYKVKDTVGPGHNPEAFRLKDGRYVIYVMGGYYTANGLDGPWERKKFEFNPRGRRIIEGLSNLTFARREDGSFLMVCRGGGVWLSETGISPYNQVTDQRVYPPVPGNFEDPVVWRTNTQYHLIVNDWRGRIAYYLRSKRRAWVIPWQRDAFANYNQGRPNRIIAHTPLQYLKMYADARAHFCFNAYQFRKLPKKGKDIKITAVTQPKHGKAVVLDSGNLAYASRQGYTGDDSFLYTVTDSVDKTSTAMIHVTVE